MSSGKSYGLQVPKKTNQTVAKHVAFNETESEESDAGGGSTDWLKKSLQKSSQKSTVKKQTKLDMQKALEQDSTIYQYDEIYDQLDQKKTETVSSKEKDKKPRYIQQLMNTADRRKRENERRIERQVQKDREAEGDQFKDKESFVTAAYKKKLEEFAAQEEEEKRQSYLEEIGDVTKQQDISGFYRHLYQTTVNPDENKKASKAGKSTSDTVKNISEAKQSDKKDKRQYRKRKQSESSDDKLDADSSLSSDSSSDQEMDKTEPVPDSKKKKTNESKSKRTPPKESPVEVSSSAKSQPSESKAPKPPPEVVKPPKKAAPDLTIWEKRCVGQAFDDALKRFLERKAAKSRSV